MPGHRSADTDSPVRVALYQGRRIVQHTSHTRHIEIWNPDTKRPSQIESPIRSYDIFWCCSKDVHRSSHPRGDRETLCLVWSTQWTTTANARYLRRPSAPLHQIVPNMLTKSRSSSVRAVLGLFNGASLIGYASAVRRAYGSSASTWYTFFQGAQFHVLYYSSRTLPNMFAFGISR